MPYIGKSPQQGNYSKLDDFSGDFDGSDVTHAIASGGTAIDPITPNALIISINGVIQEPATDYTVSGSNITFTTAPAAGDNFFGVALGEGVSIGTPSNSTITAAKLSSAVLTGHTDIGGAIADADLFLVDDGAGGTLRKTAASRLKTYAGTTIANNTDNYVTTATGTGLNGEANLTFDGTTLAVAGTVEPSGDTAAGDNAAIGYTAGEGLILTGQGSTDDITIKNDADTTVVNVATGGTDVEISAGNLLFGTANKGVYLGVTSATAANLLDDYEEGTYTASVTASTSGSYTMQAANDLMAYTKVGNMVTVVGYVNVDSESSPSGNISVALPFAVGDLAEYSNAGYTRGGTIINHADGTASTNVVGWIHNSDGAKMAFYEEVHATGAIIAVQHDHVDAAFSVTLSFSYFTG